MHKKKIIFKGYTKRDILIIAVFAVFFHSILILFTALNKITGYYIVNKDHIGKTVWDFSFISTPTFAIIIAIVGISILISQLMKK